MSPSDSKALPPPIEERDRAIVLVHGAWVGEWCWTPILPTLRAAARPVHAVSLRGHGARHHESGPDVTLGAHVADVVGVIQTHDLMEVTLVGHSYGGRVITRVAAEVAERLGAIVYLDAHAPVADSPAQGPDRIAAAEAHGGMLPFSGYARDLELLGDDEARRWFRERLVPQSFACFNEPWQRELPSHLRCTYVFATENPETLFEDYARVCANHPDWHYHEVAAPHFLMLTHPEEVAEIILGA